MRLSPISPVLAAATAVLTCMFFGTLWGLLALIAFSRRDAREELLIGICVWAAAALAGALQYRDARRSRPHKRYFGFLIFGSVVGAWLTWPAEMGRFAAYESALTGHDAIRFAAPIVAAATGAILGAALELAITRSRRHRKPIDQA